MYPPITGDFIYTNCSGEPLKLSDSDSGSNMEYRADSHYVWIANKDGRLLFSFPTRVSLTIITLHYYSNSDRGLPRLRFYAVPDGFNVWNDPTTSSSTADIAAVPPGGEPVGHSCISINVTFSTMKVLMYKFSSSFLLAMSEVDFLTCNCKQHLR